MKAGQRNALLNKHAQVYGEAPDRWEKMRRTMEMSSKHDKKRDLLKEVEAVNSSWMADHPLFVEWWKQHRHSGFAEDKEGKWHWNVKPWTAHKVDRYRAEFESDNLIPAEKSEAKYQYSFEEIEGWAREQQSYVEEMKKPEPPKRRRFVP
jgi:hypothetical protein